MDRDGGEWRSYGHDYANTRTQPDELTLGSLGVLAQLDEAEGEAAGPNAELLGARRVELLVLPALVRILQRGRQAQELTSVERRQPAPDLELAVAVHLGQVELTDTRERPHEG